MFIEQYRNLVGIQTRCRFMASLGTRRRFYRSQ